MEDFRNTWELYSSAWKKTVRADRIGLLEKSVDRGCCYTDTNIVANGHDELIGYMEDFHSRVPGGHFETVNFISHHGFGLARWNMLNQLGKKIGEGYSHLKYTKNGKLMQMTGFFHHQPDKLKTDEL